MPSSIKGLLALAAVALLVLPPAKAVAQGAELTPFAGYLFGSSIDPEAPVGGDAPASLARTFDNSFTWGVRGAYFFAAAPNIGLEGSFTQSPFANLVIDDVELDSRATYVDLNLVVQGTHSAAQFYGTAGLGMTRFRLGASEGGQTHTKLGVNFGGGVKVPLWSHGAGRGRWGLRFDVRDQWLRLEADDSMRSNFRQVLQLPVNSADNIHNVVTTVGVHFWF